MHKTSLVVDRKKLERARRILRTRGIGDTIDRALDVVLALNARKRAFGQLKSIDVDLGDERTMSEAWK